MTKRDQADDQRSEPEPTPVVPAPADVAPSSTGVVVGDGSEPAPAEGQSPDQQ